MSIGKAPCVLNMFFWVFPRRQIVVGRRFGTLYQFHLQRLVVDCLPPAFEDGTDTVFQNVGQLQFDAGEIPKRTFSTVYLSYIFLNTFVLRVGKHHGPCETAMG